ncbi:exodeoxyribonuclease V subunit gamma [Candidatus Similichlamydia epinepheli]|uniref:exodeoxyribonuclease V subunit gamma n=1 Tax=Candidatus Similichlamydia epinepheli TaxID=1903953 RepID=UPI000D386CE0|nr:exodeoxyribonuclease V subunit gamma [Candidatus Similichlamydia epinepheli]
MPPFWNCFFSHDLGSLASLFFEHSRNRSSILKSIIFSNGRAMSLWLDLYLARNHGLSWGLDYHCIHSLFSKVDAFHNQEIREELFWDVAETVKDLSKDGSFPPPCGRVNLYATLDKALRSLGEMPSYQRCLVWKKHHSSLWGRLCLDGKTRRDRFEKWRESDPQAICAKEALGDSIYIFGVDWLSPFQLEFLQWISHSIELTLYVFSPSASFWGDENSLNRKNFIFRRLIKKGVSDQEIDEIGQSFDDSHPFLTCYGSTARTFLHSLEEYGASIKGIYPHSARQSHFCQNIFSDEIIWGDRDPSLLDRIKESLLLSIPLKINSRGVIPYRNDTSLRVHCAPDAFSQITLVREEIKTAIKDGFKPDEIIVLAPDLERFESFISLAFSNSPELDIGIRIWSMNLERSHLFFAFSSWMDLVLSSWGKEDLLNFLSKTSWNERLGIDISTWKKVLDLIERQPLFWGVNKEHQALFSPDGSVLDRGKTWQEVSSSLVLSLFCFPHHPGGCIPFPPSFQNSATPCLPIVDFLQLSQCLNRLLSWLDEGINFLSHFLFRNRNKPSYWVKLLIEYIELFPLLDGEEEVVTVLKEFLCEKQWHWGDVSTHVDPDLLWERLSQEAAHLFEGWKGSDAIDVVSFAPLLVMKSIPYRVVLIIGLDESFFPRSDGHKWMNGKVFLEYEPCSISVDRYAFLESICAAQDRLILFYSHSKECQSLEENSSSSVLDEFLTFLGKCGVDVRPLPENSSFHQIHSLSDKDIYPMRCREPRGWLELVTLSSIMSLEDMRLFLRNPAIFFLKKILRIKDVHPFDSINIRSKNFFAAKRVREQNRKYAHDWIQATWPLSFASFEERIMLSQIRHSEYQVICSDALRSPERSEGDRYLFPAISVGSKRVTGSFSHDLKVDSNGLTLPEGALESIRSILPFLADLLAFRLLVPCFGFEGKIRSWSGHPVIFSFEESEKLLEKLFLLCLQGSTCLLPWPFFSRTRESHNWSTSLPATMPNWLIHNLEESITSHQRAKIFQSGWEDLVITFEEGVKDLFSKLHEENV